MSGDSQALRSMLASCTNAILEQSATNQRLAAALERQAATNERVAQAMDRHDERYEHLAEAFESRLKQRISELPPPMLAMKPALATLILAIGLAALVGSVTAAAWISELQPRHPAAQECTTDAEPVQSRAAARAR